MKKRIISLILVLVMLCLALASCGTYSIANEDITAYTSFDAEAQAKFEAAWKTLVIKDGDFTTDEAKRQNKVMDSIYKDLANAVEDPEELKTGIPGGRDSVYYNYYYTAEFDGKTVYFSTSNMKSGSTSKFQLGLEDPSDFQKALMDLIAGKDIKDYIYSTDTSGKVKEGEVVFVTYKYTEKETKEDGTVVDLPAVTVTNERIVLTKGASKLVDHILAKEASIDTSIEDFSADGRSYTGIKINWRAKGAELGVAKNTPYDEETKVKDITGKEYDLNGVELSYHVYPAYFVKTPEFTSLNFVNMILDDGITLAAIVRTVFGEKFAEEYNEKTDAEKAELLKAYVTKDKDNKDVTLEALVESIAKAQKDLASAETAFEKAESDEKSKKATYDDAKSKYDTEKDEEKKAERKAALDTAEKNYDAAKKTLKEETENRDKKLKERDDLVNKLLAVVDMNKDSDKYSIAEPDKKLNLTEGYIRLTYEYLRDKYNEEVRMNLAEAIYALFEKHVNVTSVPEEAIDVTYDRLMENYEYDFYNGTYDETAKISNYKAHNGSFKSFLIEEVNTADKDATPVKDYKAACEKVRADAEEYIKPILMIYAISNAYDLIVDDEEFDDYKEDEEGSFNVDSYNYGENSVRYAYQFDALMNYILEYEEADNGSYSYKNVVFTVEDAE